MSMVLDFIQTACVLSVLSYLLSRVNFFSDVKDNVKLTRGKLLIIVAVFLFVSLYGTLTKNNITSDLYVDTRIAGIVLAGVLFGYKASFLVLIPTAIISIIIGEKTLVADIIAMAVSSVFSGFFRKKYPETDAVLSGIIVGFLEIVHMLLIAYFIRPLTEAKEIIYNISFPMIIVNGLAVLTFITIITDMNERKTLWKKENFSKSSLYIAGKLQDSLLEKNFDIDPRMDLCAYLTPALDIGGDLYSFSINDGNTFKFIVGDVSGKGIPAAIAMSRTETLFQELALSSNDPSQIISSINKRLCYNNKAMMFVTACVGCLDISSGLLTYSNAGHVSPYIVSKQRPSEKLTPPNGKPLGVLMTCKYENAEYVLAPGQYFITYTDGITEAENINKELFGNQRLEDTLDNLSKAESSYIKETVLSSVHKFSEGALQSDDMALFIFGIRRKDYFYSLPNSITEYCKIEEKMVNDFTEGLMKKTTADDVCLVVEEVVSNIIKYGYKDDRKGEISISVTADTETVITITDDSDGFDQLSLNMELPKVPVDKRELGGLGLILSKNRITNHSYNSENGKNTLIINIRKGGLS